MEPVIRMHAGRPTIWQPDVTRWSIPSAGLCLCVATLHRHIRSDIGNVREE
jgi:hypothetical protein